MSGSEILRLFVGATYRVAAEINPRGYNWSETYLDQALAEAKSILAASPPQASSPSGPVAEEVTVSNGKRIPADVCARQLMGLYYELSGMPDMAADVRSDDWEVGSGFGPGSERQLLTVMATLVETVRKEEMALASSPVAEPVGEGLQNSIRLEADFYQALYGRGLRPVATDSEAAHELNLAAGRIIDIMTGGKFDWRERLEDSDFLESADWMTALAYARAALPSDLLEEQP